MNGNNFYFNGGDPLLGGGKSYNVDEQMQELERMQQELAQRQQILQQSKAQIQQQQQAQPPKSGTPVWDEIDRIVQAMSEQEFTRVSENEEFRDSSQKIAAIVQSVQLQAIRPQVEATKEGKEALDYHLTLVKRLRNAAAKEVDDEIADFKEYKEKYSDMSYADYQKMKREKKGGKR